MTESSFSKAPQILLVEDNANLSYFLKRFLENKGYEISALTRGDEALKRIAKSKFDLYLIDLGLPFVDGCTILKRVKEVDPSSKVIIITDIESKEEELNCYENGVNVFHRKPIDYKLLEVQVRNILKGFENNQILTLGDLSLDMKSRIIKKNGIEIRLTFNEFNLLLMLMKDTGAVFSRSEIVSRVLNNYDETDVGAVDTLISRLRKKLDYYGAKDVIETIYKAGFRLGIAYKA